jgi:hypothetical protein
MYYATESDEQAPHALPNILVTRFTAYEIAETMYDEIHEYSKRHNFRIADMNGRIRDAMLEAIVEELEVTGGFMWCVCLPGCLPDSEWSGPFATEEEAVADARAVLND